MTEQPERIFWMVVIGTNTRPEIHISLEAAQQYARYYGVISIYEYIIRNNELPRSSRMYQLTRMGNEEIWVQQPPFL